MLRNNVRLLGNEQATDTLMFAHGFGTDQSAWTELIRPFSDRYRIVVFDYVGANEKTVSYFDPYRYRRLNAFAEDILDIIETLQLTQLTFIGPSAGGMSGSLAAILEPDWFSKMILLNPSPRYLNEANYVGGFSDDDLTQLFQQMENNYHAWVSGFAPIAMANSDRPHLAGKFARTLLGMRPDVALVIARAIFYSDHRADLPKLSHRTLIVQARHDIAVPNEVGYYMQERIPNASLTFVETEGHLPHISDTATIVEAIRPFLN